MTRGEIWWANLEEPVGSAPGFVRPVLIVQSDDFNRTGIATVIVASLTSNLTRATAPGNVVVSERETGLPRRSVVNITQTAAIDRSLLIERVGSLPGRRMAEVDTGLKLVLGLA